MKTLISITIGILILGGLVWIARPGSGNDISNSPQKSSGVLTVEEKSYDFGTISMAKGVVRRQFKIKNTSNEAVTINKMYTSCMCTTARLMSGGKQFGPYGMLGHGAAIPRIDSVINPNEEATVEVAFDPAAHGPAGVGRIERVVTLENNTRQPVELQFTAMVTP